MRGIRMPKLDLMVKALRLAWLPRLLNPAKQNWKSIPDHYFRKYGGLNFLLRCSYDSRYLDLKLPTFYRDTPSFFTQIKSQFKRMDEEEMILFNNKEILIGGRPFRLQQGMLLERNYSNKRLLKG